MSSPEAGVSSGVRQPFLSRPRAYITSSCAADVYLGQRHNERLYNQLTDLHSLTHLHEHAIYRTILFKPWNDLDSC